ncbi:unnamed protein product [Cuscuta campestris]|uniref:Cytochrome P450 n=1 Tax=Cuscuta campestris TaxID=132261 RepID=A0A484MW89_9ASTE|nr:unnamed protein product [Cuscuta campestris]
MVAVATNYVIQYFHKRYNYHPKCNGGGALPPGSFGLPLVGETLSLLAASHSLDLHPFLSKRFQKYGLVFKTSIAGRATIVSADPELNHHLFLQEGRRVELWYLDTFSNLFAQDGERRTNAAGEVHRYIRGLTLNHFGAESIRARLLPPMQQTVRAALDAWCAAPGSVELKHSISMMVFNFTAKIMFGYEGEKSQKILISERFTHFVKAMVSFPVNIPGTTFYKVMKEKERIMDMIRERVREKGGGNGGGDLLDQALQDMRAPHAAAFLNEDFIVQVVFSGLFASFESNSTTLTLALYFLSQNPDALEELRAEHDSIINKRENPNSNITWDEFKSMTFTLQVINETLRIANTAPGLLRRATKDINFNGYSIPAGWTIMIASSAHHLNPNTFKDPLAFNPWRWKGLDSSAVCKNFMPFGGGMRQCAGAEFSRAFMCAFLHVLVTEYEWNLANDTSNISRMPFLSFGDGVHINIHHQNKK